MNDGTLDRDEFEARYVVAADTCGYLAGTDELDRAYAEYRDGRLAMRLVDPTPEQAVFERALARSIGHLLDDPTPADPRWCSRLRARVDHLAAVTRADSGRVDEDDEPWPRELFCDAIWAGFPGVFDVTAERP